MWSTADCIRILLLLIFGLGALHFTDWFFYLIIGGILASILHWLLGLNWSTSLQFGIAIVFVMPIFINILFKNIRILIAFTVFLGIPTFLISSYAFGSNLFYALGYSLAVMNLLPFSIIRILSLTGLSKKIDVFIKFSHLKTKYPQFLESIKDDPKLFNDIKRDPDRIINLEKYPKLFSTLNDNPYLLKLMISTWWPPDFLKALDGDPHFLSIFRGDPGKCFQLINEKLMECRKQELIKSSAPSVSSPISAKPPSSFPFRF